MSHSSELWRAAQTVIPGGVNSPVRAFKAVGGQPIFFTRGSGPYLYDSDNKQYVDFVGSWGPLILGHAHPKVTQAVQEAIQNGLSFGAPTPIEVEMAQTITRLIPSIKQVRFVNSGTEATQTAIRLARGYTQRKKILKFEGCYHGHADCLLVKAGSGCSTFGQPSSAGVPEEFVQHTLIAPFNDLGATRSLFETFDQDIAAVIVEPIAGNMNCIPPLPGFLPGLRKICSDHKTLLIFDEVITGFRVGLGGAQALYQVVPDLTCLGKIIGGGLPVGAFGGRQEIMALLSPLGPVYQAGTLSGNPITLTAGLAALKEIEELEKLNLYETLNQTTTAFLEDLRSLAKDHDIPLMTQSVGSLFGLFFTEASSLTNYQQVTQHCSQTQFTRFFHGMLKEGVYFAPSAFEAGFISSAHTQAVLDYTLNAAQKVFKHGLPLTDPSASKSEFV